MELLRRYERLGERFNPSTISVRDSLRVNTLKIAEKDLIKRLRAKGVTLKRVPFLEHGYHYSAPFSLGATPEYLLGYYYLQEAASQLPVQVLDPKPGEHVLDMAASPGSKTTQLGQRMENKGVVVALDNDARRLASLLNNLERCSVTNVILYKKDSRFAHELGLEFDKVLLDAPCSGNFCVEKDFFMKRSIADAKRKAAYQREMLVSAVKCLKKGGTLVYSTCSLEPEEDEMNVDWLLKEFPEMRLADTGLKIGDSGYTDILGVKLSSELLKTRRLWPHKTGTEGFFIAKLRKTI